MAPSSHLRRHWRAASDEQVNLALRNARTSVAAFSAATAEHGSLIQNWISGREVLEFEHYPPDDLVDVRKGSQFYYHSHRDGDQEHGHLHLFWHATASGRRRYLKPRQTRWNRTEPTHLFAISLDARGLPVGLFTVNQWVTDGHWFDAATTMACVDRFAMGEIEGFEHSCNWLTGFVRLYRPLIDKLLVQRDRRMERRSDLTKALQDRNLEVLSSTPIDWVSDMNALEEVSALRGGKISVLAAV